MVKNSLFVIASFDFFIEFSTAKLERNYLFKCTNSEQTILINESVPKILIK